MLSNKNYHDWYLVGISTDIQSDSLELKLVSNKEHSLLRFRNVKRCLVNNFTIGNIVLDVTILSGNMEGIDRLTGSASFISLIGTDPNSTYFKNMIDEIKNGNLVYVEIAPSYGCSVQVVCKSIEEE